MGIFRSIIISRRTISDALFATLSSVTAGAEVIHKSITMLLGIITGLN